jgi:hypothetical protein
MCTNKEIINTGINIDTVNESKLNPHKISINSESIHLNNLIVTVILLNPTSKKTIIDKIVVIKIELQVISLAPETPIFLPKNPDDIEPNKGKNIKDKYIKLFVFYRYTSS